MLYYQPGIKRPEVQRQVLSFLFCPLISCADFLYLRTAAFLLHRGLKGTESQSLCLVDPKPEVYLFINVNDESVFQAFPISMGHWLRLCLPSLTFPLYSPLPSAGRDAFTWVMHRLKCFILQYKSPQMLTSFGKEKIKKEKIGEVKRDKTLCR